jgi:hypothetical protein
MRALRIVGIIEEYGWNQLKVRKVLKRRVKEGKIEQLRPYATLR